METPEKDKDIRIEHLAQGQLDELIDAQNEIFQDYIVPTRSTRQFFLDFLRSVGGDLRNVLVALDRDAIVGYVNPVVDRHEAWIGGVGVVHEHRGRGIGTRLMLSAEEECRKKGAREMSLEVIDGNERARQLYLRLGYREMRKYVSAEGKPASFQGFGETPRPATLAELLPVHEMSYGDTCWQRRKQEALIQSARGAECYKVDGGFVLARVVETTGFIPFLGVVPEERGKGIGTALAKFALSRLHDLGAFKVVVYNVNDDLPALRLLDMFDFKVTLKQTEMKKRL